MIKIFVKHSPTQAYNFLFFQVFIVTALCLFSQLHSASFNNFISNNSIQSTLRIILFLEQKETETYYVSYAPSDLTSPSLFMIRLTFNCFNLIMSAKIFRNFWNIDTKNDHSEESTCNKQLNNMETTRIWITNSFMWCRCISRDNSLDLVLTIKNIYNTFPVFHWHIITSARIATLGYHGLQRSKCFWIKISVSMDSKVDRSSDIYQKIMFYYCLISIQWTEYVLG